MRPIPEHIVRRCTEEELISWVMELQADKAELIAKHSDVLEALASSRVQSENMFQLFINQHHDGSLQLTQHDDHSTKIGGDVINSQVGQSLTNCTNTIRQQAQGEKKDLLEELRGQVEQIINNLPEDKADEAPQVAENLEMLIKHATSAKPNRRWYEVSAEGLLEASKWTKDFAGNIVGTIGQLGKLIWPDYSPRNAD